MGLKELVMPDGTRRPYSVWLSGEYPRCLDGLCKSLSFDMRVVDPAWIGAKLRQLLDYPELAGNFFARDPLSQKSINWPSTVAYLVRLLIHRHAMLHILDESGHPLSRMGAVTMEEDQSAGKPRRLPGRTCPECGANAVIRKDGCAFCTACGHTGNCG
jgi:ribonucleoside-diphosphate reductase alpha chain